MVDIFPAGSVNPQYQIRTSKQTLEQAVAERKRIVSESTRSAVRLAITNEQHFTYDSYPAARFDITADDGTAPDSYITEFNIAAKGNLYVFDTGSHEKNESAISQELLTLFESIKID